MRFAQALQALEPALGNPDADARPALQALVVAIPALFHAGRCEQAIAAAHRGFELERRLGEEIVPFGHLQIAANLANADSSLPIRAAISFWLSLSAIPLDISSLSDNVSGATASLSISGPPNFPHVKIDCTDREGRVARSHPAKINCTDRL